MKRFIDCDGVIVDTEKDLFKEYYLKKKEDETLRKSLYLEKLDWEYWLKKAEVINNALEILKSYNPFDVIILTKVHSLNEAQAKIKYFRDNEIKNDIVIVPSIVKKTDLVETRGNILVDDNIDNLVDWQNKGGIPIAFGNINSEFPKVNNLEEVLNPFKLGKILKR